MSPSPPPGCGCPPGCPCCADREALERENAALRHAVRVAWDYAGLGDPQPEPGSASERAAHAWGLGTQRSAAG